MVAPDDEDWLLPSHPSMSVGGGAAVGGDSEHRMTSPEVTLENGDNRSPLPWDTIKEVAAEPPKKRQKMATAKPPSLVGNNAKARKKSTPPASPKSTSSSEAKPVERPKTSLSTPPVVNTAFSVESASNLLLYLKSNGTTGLNHFIQGTKSQVKPTKEGDSKSGPPVSLQVLIPSTSVPGTDPIASLIEAIQSPSNQSLLNHIITSASNNKQPILNCTQNPSNTSVPLSAVKSQSSLKLPPISVKSFPNASALKNFKIPKKKPADSGRKPSGMPRSAPTKPLKPKSGVTPPTTPPPPPVELPKAIDSIEAVTRSICLKRKRCGLSAIPCGLQFVITNSVGRKWSSYDLEGELVLDMHTRSESGSAQASVNVEIFVIC